MPRAKPQPSSRIVLNAAAGFIAVPRRRVRGPQAFPDKDGDADDVMAAGYKEAVQIGQAGNLRSVYPESTTTKFSQKTSELSGQQHEKGSVYVECI